MAELTVEPPAAQLPAAGGTSQHQVQNNTPIRLAIKIKCSDNNLYRVNPVYAFAEPGQPLPIEVTRVEGPAKEDRLVIQYQPTGEVADPQQCFPPGAAFPEVPLQLSAM